jgi:hypothetical protein
LTAAFAAALAVSACNTTTTTKLLDNLAAGCERHYDGTIGASMAGGQFQGTVKIDCAPTSPAPRLQ